jgi:phosphatidylinositol alpha-1,6-mannosyltransferase
VTILLLTQVFPPRTGGSGRWLWELYRRLKDVSVQVVAGNETGAEAFDRIAPFPVSRVDLDLPNWGLAHPGGAPYYARRLLEVMRIVRRIRPSVIHCGKCLPEGLLAYAVKFLSGIPFLTYAHGEELTLAETSRELAFLTRRVLGAASSVIANSVHTRQLLIERWAVPSVKIVVMHPGVDTTTFLPATADAQVKSALGWAGRRVILTVGALQKRKGQDMMIRALPMIRASVPEVLYAMMGQGLEREYLERVAAEHQVTEVVQFRGAPDDRQLLMCYQQCDLFALPNRQVGWDIEGFGIVSIEAQACGKPVIVGASGGAPETVESLETGLVVNSDEPDHLAEATIRLLTDPELRARMGAAGRRRAVERFDWTILAHQADAFFGVGSTA